MNRILKHTSLFLCLALFVLATIFFVGTYQKVYAAGYYDFEFTQFYVKYDINPDLTMQVSERFTVKYEGSRSTGIMRDIPVNAGDRVRNVRAYEVIDGVSSSLEYTVNNSEDDFITVDMGDRTIKTGQSHTYLSTYDYAVTKPTSENTLYLNAIGFGSEQAMRNVTVELNLPDGFRSAQCFTEYGNSVTSDFLQEGNKITFSSDELPAFRGVTFELNFDEGILHTKADITPYIVFIAACVLIAALIAVKFLRFSKGDITVVPNFDACDKYDPLMMGKLLDNAAENEDVTSLIYYWADKGYLKIDMTDESDAVLIRVTVNLPDNAPEYQKLMFNNLFATGECVRISSLKNRFYTTVDQVKAQCNTAVPAIYDRKSVGASLLFATAGALFMALTPIFIAFFSINTTFVYLYSLLAIPAVIAVYILTKMAKERLMKYTRLTAFIIFAGIILLCAGFTAIYWYFVASFVVETIPKILLCAAGFAITMLSVTILCRTDEYDRQLGEILGFKDFISNVEKDKLEMMLSSNPEMYYKVLPYAQVLGVSDIWEEKFKDLTVQPPTWAVGYNTNFVFNYVVFNALLRTMRTDIARTLVSKPSSRGLSGGGFGGRGGFGGHGGGGHGGGGFRGR